MVAGNGKIAVMQKSRIFYIKTEQLFVGFKLKA